MTNTKCEHGCPFCSRPPSAREVATILRSLQHSLLLQSHVWLPQADRAAAGCDTFACAQRTNCVPHEKLPLPSFVATNTTATNEAAHTPPQTLVSDTITLTAPVPARVVCTTKFWCKVPPCCPPKPCLPPHRQPDRRTTGPFRRLTQRLAAGYYQSSKQTISADCRRKYQYHQRSQAPFSQNHVARCIIVVNHKQLLVKNAAKSRQATPNHRKSPDSWLCAGAFRQPQPLATGVKTPAVQPLVRYRDQVISHPVHALRHVGTIKRSYPTTNRSQQPVDHRVPLTLPLTRSAPCIHTLLPPAPAASAVVRPACCNLTAAAAAAQTVLHPRPASTPAGAAADAGANSIARHPCCHRCCCRQLQLIGERGEVLRVVAVGAGRVVELQMG